MHAVKLTNPEALFDSAYTPTFELYVDGVQVTPSAASLTMCWPGYALADAEFTDRACTLSESADEITCAIPASERETEPIENYRLILKYTYSGTVYTVNFLFDDCRTPLTCSVVDDDLKKLYPEIADHIWDGHTTYTAQIGRAFDDVRRKLKEKGRRAVLMVDASQVNDLVVIRTLAMIFNDFAKSTEDIWWQRYLKMSEQFEADFANLSIDYDEDEGGDVESAVGFGNVRLDR